MSYCVCLLNILVYVYLLRLLPGQVSYFGDTAGGFVPVEYLCLIWHSDGLSIVFSFAFGIYGLIASLGSSKRDEASCLLLAYVIWIFCFEGSVPSVLSGEVYSSPMILCRNEFTMVCIFSGDGILISLLTYGLYT